MGKYYVFSLSQKSIKNKSIVCLSYTITINKTLVIKANSYLVKIIINFAIYFKYNIIHLNKNAKTYIFFYTYFKTI